MQKKTFSINLLPLLFLLLNSCATNPPNAPVCVEINPSKGGCVKIISGEKFVVDDDHPFEMDGKKYTWWDIRPIMVQVPYTSWALIKEFIIKICKKTDKCQKEVGSWDRSVQVIDDQLKEKMP